MVRTALFPATVAMGDNISYYIFSEVIEASAQRKGPPFCRLFVHLPGCSCAVMAAVIADEKAIEKNKDFLFVKVTEFKIVVQLV